MLKRRFDPGKSVSFLVADIESVWQTGRMYCHNTSNSNMNFVMNAV